MYKKIYKYNNMLFYISYILMILNATLIKNIIPRISHVLIALYISLFIFNIVLKKYNKKEFRHISAFFLLIMVVFFNSKERDLFILGTLILSSKGVNFRKLVKIDFITRLWGITMTIILCLIGVINDFIMYRYDLNNFIIEIRHSLGFIHPNTLSVNILILLMGYIYLRYKNIKLIEFILIFIIMYIFSKITGSRNGVICITITILLFYLEKIFNIFSNNWVKHFIVYSVVLCTVLSILLTTLYKYDYNVINIVNSLLTGRIKSASYFLDTYGFSLLGQKVNLVSIIQSQQTSEQMRILDNLYMSLAIRSGIILLYIYIIMYMKLYIRLFNEKKICEIILVVVICLSGLIEKVAISPELNFTSILLSMVFFNDKVKYKYKEYISSTTSKIALN